MHAHSELASNRPTTTKAVFVVGMNQLMALTAQGQGMRLNLHSTVGCLHVYQVVFKLLRLSLLLKGHTLGWFSSTP